MYNYSKVKSIFLPIKVSTAIDQTSCLNKENLLKYLLEHFDCAQCKLHRELPRRSEASSFHKKVSTSLDQTSCLNKENLLKYLLEYFDRAQCKLHRELPRRSKNLVFQ